MFKLQVFVVLFVLRTTVSKPIDSSAILNEAENVDSENYDIIIDQRQNGTQNFRIKVSGLTLAIPDDRQEPSPSDSATLEQFASLLSPATSGGSHPQNVNLDDFSELAAFFDWKKKSQKKNSDFTQSRTKDIPTDSQIAEDPKTKVQEIVKDERRKYKLLVGEKYLIPILRFLKKQAEEE